MSEAIQKLGYGYIDDRDESLRSKTGGQFGLNVGAHITKFELNTMSGKDKTAGDALDIVVAVGDKDFTKKIFPVSKIYDKAGNEITDVNSPEYIKGFNTEIKQTNAVILHFLKALGVSEERIRQAFATPVYSFGEFINGLVALLPANFSTIPVDVFLEYQWDIADGQDQKFLQLPKNMKGGYFACPAQPGTWVAERDAKEGLIYRNQNGAQHPFDRDKAFMEGKKANQEKAGEESAGQSALAAAAGIQPGNGAAQKSTW